jgi:NADH-quinone oxidoreductase subunit G
VPRLSIDGREVTVAPGTLVIRAAEKVGIRIPRYCYHPGLSVEGNCRMCTVHIEKMPKLATACTTPVAEGMVVSTTSAEVKEAQQAVLEFLLLNHPLDCPVCDAAGECDLQNYYLAYGRYDARFAETKFKKRKVVDIGPTVILDTERCILCTRCVRFTKEITRTSELGVVNRGFRSEIALFPGKKLDNLYSGSVVDICPVGALTDKDFRFQCRPWYLRSTSSVCTHCSRGCNITVNWQTERPHHGGGKRVFRIKPRENPAVNRWWICDIGRYGYHFVDSGRRLRKPLIEAEGAMVPASWKRAIGEAAAVLGSDPTLLVGGDSSNEELWALRLLVGERAAALCYVPPAEVGDDLLYTGERAPNLRGAEFLGYRILRSESPARALDEASRAGRPLLVVGKVFADSLGSLGVPVVAVSPLWGEGRARVALPGATWVEKEGTFTNFEGRIQRFQQALDPLGEALPELEIAARLAAARGGPALSARPAEVFAALGRQMEPFAGLSYPRLGDAGVLIGAETVPSGRPAPS